MVGDHPTYTVKTGYTADNGKTWKSFGDESPGVSGVVAMSSSDPKNLVWAPVKADVKFSLDGGNSWQSARLIDGSLLPRSWQVNNVWWPGQILVPDMVTGGKFYFYNNGDFYVSTDNGATWAKTATITTAGQAAVAYTVYSSIVPNPAKAGDLFMTFARNANQATPFQLLHSTDGGRTFTVVPTLSACNYLAFGKGNDAQTPYMYVHGRLKSSDPDAVYKSEDAGATWVPITDPALNQFGSIMVMEGDMRERDLVYIGTSGRGILYGVGPKFGVPLPPPETSSSSKATFLRADTATLGNWKTAYGAEGYNVIGDLASYPSYISATTQSGGALFNWTSSTTDPRALQKASNAADRIEAGWYSSTSMVIDVPVTDTATHQIALYMADWDFTTRRQVIEVLDGNGVVLNTQSLTSSFYGGVYLVWSFSGHVKFRITSTGTYNCVLSGIFFGGAPASTPPATSSSKATFLSSDTATLGNWKTVYGAEGYNVIGDLASYPSYASATQSGGALFYWTSSTTDPRALQKASNAADRIEAGWYSSTSIVIDVPVTDTATHQIALYMADWDFTTRRQVIEVLDGNGVVLNTQSLTSSFHGGVYLVWSFSGHVKFRITSTGTYNCVLSGIFFGGAPASTPPPAASSSKATFLSSDTVTLGNWKTVYGAEGYNVIGDLASYPSYASATTQSGGALFYWASSTTDTRGLQKASNAADRIEAGWYSPTSMVIDVPVTDTATHQIALYMTDWDYTTRRQVIEVLDGNGAVLNTQSLTSSFHGGVYLVWSFSGHVKFRITSTGTYNCVLSGIFFGGRASAAPVSTATFVRSDTTTAGTWKGNYGSQGYVVAGDQASYPAYAPTVQVSGGTLFYWAWSTTDPRGLQKALNPNDRLQAGWYSPTSFTVDVPITDTAVHQVALYMADYDYTTRRQIVDVLDSGGAVLNSQALTSSFHGGVYLVWNVSGSVKFRITSTGTYNGVLSGIFFQ